MKDIESGKSLNRLRLRVFDLLEPAAPGDIWSKVTDGILVMLIMGNVAAFILDSVAGFSDRFGGAMFWFTAASGLIFTIEYLARVWSSVEVLHGRDMTYFERRIRFMLRPMSIIDLVVVLSFWLVTFVPVNLQALRAVRILSFLRMVRYSPAMVALLAVFKTEKRSLISSAGLLIATIIISGTAMFYLEKDAQPETFTDIPTSIYFVSTVVSTVGFGDISPVTPLGRAFGVIVMFLGVGFGAVLLGVISASFAQHVGQRDFISIWGQVTAVPLFAKLEIEALQLVTERFQTLELKAGDELLKAGTPIDKLYIVKSGKLLIEAETYTQLLGRGSYFGELSLLAGRKTRADITADTDAKLLVLSRDDFEKLVNAQADIKAGVNHVVRHFREGADDRLVTEGA